TLARNCSFARSAANPQRCSVYRIILSVIIILLGIALVAGGIWLAFLGGSWFYILLGLLLAISSALLLVRRASGLLIYGLTILVSVAWGVWEVGFDWWALVPRGALILVLGVLLLLPPMVRAMRGPEGRRTGYGLGSGVLAGSIAVAAIVGVYSMF